MDLDLEGLSNSQLMEIAPILLADSETMISMTRILLERLTLIDASGLTNESSRESKSILQVLAGGISPDYSTTQMLVQYLECAADPLIVIELMSSLIGETKQEVNLVVEVYKELINSDRKYLIPIIGSLSELALSDQLKNEVFEMASKALDVVEEDDFPTIVRTLLKTMKKENSKELIQTIRNQSKDLTDNTCVLLLEIISNILRINSVAINSFLSIIERETNELSFLDISISISLLSVGSISGKAIKAITEAIRNRALTLDNLLKSCKRSQVLQYYSNSLVVLCNRFLTLGKQDTFFFNWSPPLFSLIFETYPSIRSTLISSLLTQCSSVQYETSSGYQPKKKRSMDLIGDTKINIAFTAAKILFILSSNQPQNLVSHGHLLEELLQHYSNIPKVNFHLICQTLALLCREGGSVHNSLLIYIQKQVFSGLESVQTAGLICASQIMHSASPSLSESNSIINWVSSFLETCPPSKRFYGIDFISYNAPNIQKHKLERVNSEVLLPSLDQLRIIYERFGSIKLELIPIFHLESKSIPNTTQSSHSEFKGMFFSKYC